MQSTTNNPDEKKCTMPLTSMRNSEILKKWSEIQTVIISYISFKKYLGSKDLKTSCILAHTIVYPRVPVQLHKFHQNPMKKNS